MKRMAKDWSLKNVIGSCETSSFKETTISSRYSESMFTFRHNNGVSGKIKTFIMPDMEVSRMDIDCKENLVAVQDDALERHVCTFIYNGYIYSNFASENTILKQARQQHSFVHARANGSEHTIAAGHTSILYINLRPSALKNFVPDWDEYAHKLYKKNSYEKFYISPALNTISNSRLQQILLSMYGDIFSSVTRSLFVEAKAMELLALQIDELLKHTEKRVPDTFIINKTDKEKLVALYEYISDNYLLPLSMSRLAKQFTLNEFKLKKGFKQLYNQSAFNYMYNLRMNKAQELLYQGDLTVNEVSDMVGYSSIHNFSNAFYKLFKYRPSMVKSTDVNIIAA